VVTRPRSVNGLGWEPRTVEAVLSAVDPVFPFWDDVPGIATEWLRLVVSLGIKGVQVHDANHAAAAIVHGATHVLTLDQKDFVRYAPYGLTSLAPTDI